MLYKFKSKATGDLVMLQPNGRRVLEIVSAATGISTGDQGIIQPAQMAAAVTALREAIAREEAEQAQAEQQAKAEGRTPLRRPEVSLRQRAQPFITMLQRAEKEEADIVWGV
jgi:cyclopropane-fatty-acyl-phospholipid synthase